MWQLLSWFTYLRIQLLRSGHPDHKQRSCIYSITFHNENFKRIYYNNTVERKGFCFVFRAHEQLFSFPSKLDLVFSRTWFAFYNSRILKAHWTVDHRESLIMLYLKSELTFFIFFVQKYSNCGHMIWLWLERQPICRTTPVCHFENIIWPFVCTTCDAPIPWYTFGYPLRSQLHIISRRLSRKA